MKKIFFVSMLCICINYLNAQTSNLKRPASYSVYVGVKTFMNAKDWKDLSPAKYVFGNFGSGNVGSLSKPRGILGGQYIKGLSSNFDFVTGLDFANVVYPYTSNKPWETSSKLLLTYNIGINAKLVDDSHVFIPYATGGLTASLYNFSKFGEMAHLGAGFQLKVGESKFLSIQAANYFKINTWTSRHGQYTLSFSAPLKAAKAPVVVTPPPAPIEKDTDADGLVDSKDKCPTLAGLAKYGGCPIPDTDKDGINDEEDKCPTIAGLAKYGGCPIPDTDKDGINDEEDKCPTIAGLAKYGGCPIPDTDKDGINDEMDKCPTEPGIAANSGCPDIQTDVNKLAKSVYFTNNGTVISAKSFPSLESVVSILNKYPNTKLIIEGYTDNVGGVKKNKVLSQKRADALKTYFIKKGIVATRLAATGFGLEKPIGNNKTAAGRALNRRVELKANYEF